METTTNNNEFEMEETNNFNNECEDDFFDYEETDDYSRGYYEEEHYEEFAGTYAQDVMGYSDEFIYDAFDGEPDAYWNID